MDERRGGPLVAAGIWLGLGLGGFFDGIVFHQILQWHHMLTSAGYPPTSVANLDVNTLADGLFHAVTYLFTLIGLVVLWRASRHGDVAWSARILIGAILVGWGVFNLVEGTVDRIAHQPPTKAHCIGWLQNSHDLARRRRSDCMRVLARRLR